MSDVMYESDLPNLTFRGKVRDTYDLGDELLIVVTDRISVFDVVLPAAIPRKGEVLSRLSAWWFDRTKEVVPNHFICLVTEETKDRLPFAIDPKYYGRSMIVRKAAPVKAECIARGYLSGSGWKEYQRGGTVTGIRLPEGLQESSRLPEPIFTPSTKADEGHDENITYEQLGGIVGTDVAQILQVRTLALYGYGRDVAQEKGIIIADTKFEFGRWNDEIILIDEALTPDSSRFWPVEGYQPGGSQPSFDKQPVRDWLASTGWKDGDPVPEVPAEVIEATTRRYLDVYTMLTGQVLPE